MNTPLSPAMPFLLLKGTTEDERKARMISLIVTAAILVALFLTLIFIKIITPIPAIPPDPEPPVFEISLTEGYGGQDVSQGGGSMGNTGTPGQQSSSDAASTPQAGQSNPTGAVTNVHSDNPPMNTGNEPSADLMNAINNFNKNKGKGTISSNGGEGTDPSNYGVGPGHGPDIGPGEGDSGHGGTGGGNTKCFRTIISKPEIVNPTQEEGKVVVNVFVDRNGNVKKAEVGSGTTTLNSVLRSTATQSAYQIRFNQDPNCAELIVLPIDIYFTLK